MILLSGNPALLLPILALLIYSSYTDVKTRKVMTLPFLIIDVFLFGFYLYFDTMLAFLVVPVMTEHYLKGKESYIPYALVLIPLERAFNPVTVSIVLTILLVKLAFPYLGMGSGDMKILQTLAIAVPTYSAFPLAYAIASPGLLVIVIAGVSMLAMVGVMKLTTKRGVKGWPKKVPKEVVLPGENHKYRVRGETATYLGPFVPFITIGYCVILLLTLL